MQLATARRPSHGRTSRHRIPALPLVVVSLSLSFLMVCFVQPDVARAKAFVFPHVLEKSGTISSTQYTFDTSFYLAYAGGRGGCPDGGGATVELYLYDQATSQPMSGDGATVCDPCTYALSSSRPTATVRMEDLINAAGGFGASSVRLGFAVLVVGGDADNVQVQGDIVNSHSGPFDLSVFGFEPEPLGGTSAKSPGNGARAFVIPHLLERSGTITNTQYTFDTTIFAAYAGGIGGLVNGGGAEVDLYLFDQATGQPLSGTGGTDVCNPCIVGMSSATRKSAFNIDDLIMTNGGGFDTNVKLAFGIIVVTGDADNVSLQTFVANSHTSAFDLSIFGFTPQEIGAVAATAVGGDIATLPRASELTGYPNPFNPRTTLTFVLAREQHVTLQVYDAAGRLVRTLLQDSRPAGTTSITWDGTDDAGASLASGVYHVRLQADGGTLRTKLVLVQ